jgi:hypothetical protein
LWRSTTSTQPSIKKSLMSWSNKSICINLRKTRWLRRLQSTCDKVLRQANQRVHYTFIVFIFQCWSNVSIGCLHFVLSAEIYKTNNKYGNTYESEFTFKTKCWILQNKQMTTCVFKSYHAHDKHVLIATNMSNTFICCFQFTIVWFLFIIGRCITGALQKVKAMKSMKKRKWTRILS